MNIPKMPKQFQLNTSYQPAGDQPDAVLSLLSGIKDGLAYQTLLGVTGSGKTFTVANVIAEVQRPAMILAPNKTLAAQLYSEMKEFFPQNAVEYFVSYYDYYQPEAYVPSSDLYIEKDASINSHIEQMRLSATKAILERKDTIVVATVSAIYGLGDPNSYLRMVISLKQGEMLDQRSLIRRLAELQYVRNETELQRTNYRVRGSVIDVFPAESEKYAIRIELFDDEIERLSHFDPLTGKLAFHVNQVTIYPKTHYVADRQIMLDAVEVIRKELKWRLEELTNEQKLVEAQRLQQRTQFDIEMILEVGYCTGIENYSRHLSGREAGQPPPTLMDYLPADVLLFIDESHVTVPQLSGMYRGDRSRKENLVQHGFRLPSALDNRPLRFDEFEALAPQTIFVSATPSKYEEAHSDNVVEQLVRPTGLLDPEVDIRPVDSQVDDLISEVHFRIQAGERVLVTTLTKRMAEDLTEYMFEQGIRVRYLHSDIDTIERVEIIRDLRHGEFDVLIGINLLREGLDLPEVSLVAVLDADKEGFLRSATTLIQTMGRAARNINGKVILYADRITGAIRYATDETKRRRGKQDNFNKMHGITPKGIQKKIKDIIEIADSSKPRSKKRGRKSKTSILSDNAIQTFSPTQLAKEIKQLEEKMYQYANDLEFERATELRDQIAQINARLLEIG